MEFYNPGVPAGDPPKDGAPGKSPFIEKNGEAKVRVPSLYTTHIASDGTEVVEEHYVPCPKGSVLISGLGREFGFHVIPPGEWWSAPHGLSDKAIKGIAPHLLSAEEAAREGIFKQGRAEIKPQQVQKPASKMKE